MSSESQPPFSESQSPSLESTERERVTEQEVIDILDGTEEWSTEAREAATKYIDQCHAEVEGVIATIPGDRLGQLEATIRGEMKIATLYLKSRIYQQYGFDELRNVLEMAEGEPELLNLADEVFALGRSFAGEETEEQN